MKKLIFAPLLAVLLLVSPLAFAIDRSGGLEEPCDCRTIRIFGKTEWSGHIILDKEVAVYPSGSLRIAPGTLIEFAIPGFFADDEIPWITVAGELRVDGSPESPVIFRNISKEPARDNQDTIAVRKAKSVSVKYSIFEGGGWALHIHETPAFIENCLFKGNYGGVRCKADNLQIFDSDFLDNKIGIRCLNSAELTVKRSYFGNNLTGIFFRSGITSPTITQNNFRNAEYDLKVGEGQTENLSLPGNYFGAEDIPAKIFDANDSEGIGRITYEPVLETPFKRELEWGR